eukprot:COSAG02_NODE_86_length_39084_cov_17.815724_30_plen_60_part_00
MYPKPNVATANPHVDFLRKIVPPEGGHYIAPKVLANVAGTELVLKLTSEHIRVTGLVIL